MAPEFPGCFREDGILGGRARGEQHGLRGTNNRVHGWLTVRTPIDKLSNSPRLVIGPRRLDSSASGVLRRRFAVSGRVYRSDKTGRMTGLYCGGIGASVHGPEG